MKFKVSICYDFRYIEKGKAPYSLEYIVLKGLNENVISIGKSKITKVAKGSIFGIYVSEDEEISSSLKQIIFKEDLKKPLFKGDNIIYSPLNYIWSVIVSLNRKDFCCGNLSPTIISYSEDHNHKKTKDHSNATTREDVSDKLKKSKKIEKLVTDNSPQLVVKDIDNSKNHK